MTRPLRLATVAWLSLLAAAVADEVPTPQEADAVHRGQAALAALRRHVEAMNVSERVEAVLQEALSSPDPDEQQRNNLEAEIQGNLTALLAGYSAEKAAMLEEKTIWDGIKLKAHLAKAEHKVEKAEAKADHIKDKAVEQAQKQAEAAAKARRDFDRAVSYNTAQVAKILKEEAEAQQRAAEKLAQEMAREKAHEQQEQEEAAEAKQNPEEAAKEKTVASTTEGPVEAAQEPPTAFLQLLLTFLGDDGGEQGSGSEELESEGREPEQEPGRPDTLAEREAEIRAVESSPKRFEKSLKKLARELKHLRHERRKAVAKAFVESYKRDQAKISKEVEAVMAAASKARDASAHAASAGRTLNETGDVYLEEIRSLVEDADHEGHRAENLEQQIFSEAAVKLGHLLHAAEHDGKHQIRGWTRAAHKATKQTHKVMKESKTFLKKEQKAEKKQEKQAREAAHRREKREAEAERLTQLREEEEDEEANKEARERNDGALFDGGFASVDTFLWNYTPLLLAGAFGLVTVTTLVQLASRQPVGVQPPLLG